MTNNQIAYLNLQEQKRSHQASESFNLDNLAETARHNIATEEFNLSNLAETTRSNKAREDETKRHNQKTEGESVRHNLETEAIQKTSALAEKAYKEATAALNSQRLSFDKQKELTRIAESLRDYTERVRANDLDALTSRGVTTLVTELMRILNDDGSFEDNDQNTNITVNVPGNSGGSNNNSGSSVGNTSDTQASNLGGRKQRTNSRGGGSGAIRTGVPGRRITR